MPEQDTTNTQAESLLRDSLTQNASNWQQRKKLAHLLYNQGKTKEAAELVWEAPQIPSIDLELGFAIKVLAKGAPRKAIRLLSSIQENNRDKPAQNLGLANALMHHGMVMEAARFYGAAVAQSSDLASADLEHFILWTDDREKIWGDFTEEKPELGELPWMKRDAKEAAQLAKTMSGHTTPIKIPELTEVDAEKVVHEMYVQSSVKGAEATPPPSVTIPMDRVDPKDVVLDPKLGADQPIASKPAQPNAVQPNPVQPNPVQPSAVQPNPIQRNPIQRNPGPPAPAISPDPAKAMPTISSSKPKPTLPKLPELKKDQ